MLSHLRSIESNFVSGYLLISFIGIALSDEIIMDNGETIKTEIIDTVGCAVKIMRKGNTVAIRKHHIKKIIWKSDTIHYEG